MKCNVVYGSDHNWKPFLKIIPVLDWEIHVFLITVSFAIVFQLSPIKPADDQLSLSDLDMVKVIGKGSSGVVQLVQHKWTGQFFALKVLVGYRYIRELICSSFLCVWRNTNLSSIQFKVIPGRFDGMCYLIHKKWLCFI